MQRALFATVACLIVYPAIAQTETEISINEVPENIVNTASSTAPGVKFTKVSIVVEDGVSIYEFQGVDHAGRNIEVDIVEDGTLEEIEMEIAPGDVPDAVMEALDKEAPDFIPSYIEMSVRDDNAIVYEFEGVQNGVEFEIEIAETGEILVDTGNADT